MKFAKAKTDEGSFRALESRVKLKAVLVLPEMSTRRCSSNRKFHQEQMLNWLAGNEEHCWQNANKIEKERRKWQDSRKSRKGRKYNSKISRKGEKNERHNDHLTESLLKKYKRAKNLVNVGEVSKAMSAIVSNGVAKSRCLISSGVNTLLAPQRFNFQVLM